MFYCYQKNLNDLELKTAHHRVIFYTLFKIKFHGKHHLTWTNVHGSFGCQQKFRTVRNIFKCFFVANIQPFDFKIDFLFRPSILVRKVVERVSVTFTSGFCVQIVPEETNRVIFHRINISGKIVAPPGIFL